MPPLFTQTNGNRSNAIQTYTRLDQRLILIAWLNRLFGYESNKDQLDDCKHVAAGYDALGHSDLYQYPRTRGSDCRPYSVFLIDSHQSGETPRQPGILVEQQRLCIATPLTPVSPVGASPDTPLHCCQPETGD